MFAFICRLEFAESIMHSLNIYFLAFVAISFFFKSSSGNQTVYEFTKTQNDLTEEYIQSYKTSDGNSSVRDKIWDVLDSITEPAYKIPEKFGNRYFFYGGSNGVFMRDSLKSIEETHVFKEGKPIKISKDGNLMSYTSSYLRKEQTIKNITSGQDLESLSFYGYTVSWNKDSTGIIYMQEMTKRGDKAEIFLKFHKIGTNQSSDVLISDLTPAENGLTVIKYSYPELTSDDKYIMLTKTTTSAFNASDITRELWYTEYDNINWKLLKSLSKPRQLLEYIDSDKANPNIIYAKVTNLTSSTGEITLLKMDLNSDPVTEEIILDGFKEPYPNRGLNDACIINGDKLVIASADYLNKRFREKGILEIKDLKTLTTLYKKTEVASKFRISCSGKEVLVQKSVIGLPNYNFVIHVTKSEIERVEFNATLKPQPEVLEKLRDYETTVDTYRSKDGSKLPIYIVHKKDYSARGNSPIVVMLKTSSMMTMTDSAFVGMFDGILAIPMYRQNVPNRFFLPFAEKEEPVDDQTTLDDVISSVEYLIERNYTSPGKIFLTHSDYDRMKDVHVPMAVLTRPDLFAGAFISNGVFDLVKSKNTSECQKPLVQDTGYCFNQTVLEETMRMSPLENIKQGVKYPPQMIRYRPDKMEDAHAYLRKMNEISKGSPVLITTTGSEYQRMFAISGEYKNKNPGNANTLAFAAKVLGLSWKL